MREAFNVELSLRILFDAPTLLEMTVAIAQRQADQQDRAELDQLLDELENLSPKEIEALLAAELNIGTGPESVL